MTAIPVLSLWQPWASLMVLINPATGRPWKTIETRPWRTTASGPLAIQAARNTDYQGQTVGEWTWDHGFDGQPRLVRRWSSATGGKGLESHPLPLGAIIGRCAGVSVVPMVAHTDRTGDAAHLMVGTRYDPDRLLLCRPSAGYHSSNDGTGGVTAHFEWDTEVVTDQAPYGNFAPGRFAWLPDGMEPVDPPVPFRGGQGLSRRWEAA